MKHRIKKMIQEGNRQSSNTFGASIKNDTEARNFRIVF